jgi:hypothetical protein
VLYRNAMTTPDPVERPTYDYACLGGPLEGQRVISRFPDGFLLVEKPTGLAWLYDRSQVDDPRWMMRDGSPFIWDTVRSHAAAEGNTYDVIAYGAGEQTQ